MFSADGEPVAPEHGLVTQPGKYPISTLKKTYDTAQMRAQNTPQLDKVREILQSIAQRSDLYDAGRKNGRKWSQADAQASFERNVQLAKAAGILNGLIQARGGGTTGALREGGSLFSPWYRYKPRYFDFTKDFDKRMVELQEMESVVPELAEIRTQFTFHAFRVSAAWIMQLISRTSVDSPRKYKKAREALQDAIKRCTEAAEIIQPNAEIDVNDILDFSKACITVQIEGHVFKDRDDSALEALVKTLKRSPRPPVQVRPTPPGLE